MGARAHLAQALRANERLQERIAELEANRDTASQIILLELAKHVPKDLVRSSNFSDGMNPLHPGNWPKPLELWCREDSHRWPCATMNVLRELYSTVNGYQYRGHLQKATVDLVTSVEDD